MKRIDEDKNSKEINKIIFNKGTEGIGYDAKKNKIYTKRGDSISSGFSICFVNNNEIPQLWLDFYISKSEKDKRIPFIYVRKLNSNLKLDIYMDFDKTHDNRTNSQHINVKIISKNKKGEIDNDEIFDLIFKKINHMPLKWQKDGNFYVIPYFFMLKEILIKLGTDDFFKLYPKFYISQLNRSSIEYKELNEILSKYIKS